MHGCFYRSKPDWPDHPKSTQKKALPWYWDYSIYLTKVSHAKSHSTSTIDPKSDHFFLTFSSSIDITRVFKVNFESAFTYRNNWFVQMLSGKDQSAINNIGAFILILPGYFEFGDCLGILRGPVVRVYNYMYMHTWSGVRWYCYVVESVHTMTCWVTYSVNRSLYITYACYSNKVFLLGVF